MEPIRNGLHAIFPDGSKYSPLNYHVAVETWESRAGFLIWEHSHVVTFKFSAIVILLWAKLTFKVWNQILQTGTGILVRVTYKERTWKCLEDFLPTAHFPSKSFKSKHYPAVCVKKKKKPGMIFPKILCNLWWLFERRWKTWYWHLVLFISCSKQKIFLSPADLHTSWML